MIANRELPWIETFGQAVALTHEPGVAASGSASGCFRSLSSCRCLGSCGRAIKSRPRVNAPSIRSSVMEARGKARTVAAGCLPERGTAFSRRRRRRKCRSGLSGLHDHRGSSRIAWSETAGTGSAGPKPKLHAPSHFRCPTVVRCTARADQLKRFIRFKNGGGGCFGGTSRSVTMALAEPSYGDPLQLRRASATDECGDSLVALSVHVRGSYYRRRDGTPHRVGHGRACA